MQAPFPYFGDAGQGRAEYIRNEFSKLAERLRDVRVACGDFERVLTTSVTTRHGPTGVFLDPPYEAGNTDPYHTNSSGVSTRAREWCLLNGHDPMLRIVLAGYSGEHDNVGLELFGWRRVNWKAQGGYGSSGTRGRANAHREVLWLSPNCLEVAQCQ